MLVSTPAVELDLIEKARLQRRAYKFSMAELPFGLLFRTAVTTTGLVALALWMRASPLEMGVLASFPSLANAINFFAIRAAAAAGSRRRLTVGGYIMMAALYSLLPVLVLVGVLAPESLPALRIGLIVTVALGEMAQAVATVGYYAWMAEVFAPHERVRYYSRRLSGMAIANIFAALTIGQFLNLWGSGADIDPIAFLFLLPAASLAMFVAVALISRIPGGDTAEVYPSAVSAASFLEPLRDPIYRRFLIPRSLQAIANQIVGPFFIVYLAVDLGLSYGWIFALQVIYQVTAVIGFRLWERLTPRLGVRNSFLINAALFVIHPAIYALGGPWGLWVLVPLQVYGIFEGGFMLTLHILMLNLAPERRHVQYVGTANALTGTIFGISTALSGVLVVLLAQLPAIRDMSPVGSGIPALLMLGAVTRLLVLPFLLMIPEPPRTSSSQHERGAATGSSPQAGESAV